MPRSRAKEPDGSVKPKEAYYGVHAALRALARRGEVESMGDGGIDKDIVSVEYYNLQGIKVSPEAKGFLIEIVVYSDGSRDQRSVIRH